MRPKVVILTLVVAFGLLAIVAMLKGVTGKNAGGAGEQAPAAETSGNSSSTDTNDQVVRVNLNSSNSAALTEQMRAAGIRAEQDAIQEILGQADGTNNPAVIAALLEKVAHPEAEVRAAALEAIKQMNDTNAVPGLEQAEAATKDPREKVALLDTIDYLKLPSITSGVPDELATNAPAQSVMPTNVIMNPNFLHKASKKNPGAGNSRQQTALPNAPAVQPQ